MKTPRLVLVLPFLHLLLRLQPANWGGRDRHQDDPERGDVPGWVMITLMSAVLVAGLLAIAGPALEGLFRSAIDQVNTGK
ncbi:MAG: hypothetical protein JWO93_3078 [Micrococcaceae bacterium]|nr:hypothetical protein [Micrococcaceae bacterium]